MCGSWEATLIDVIDETTLPPSPRASSPQIWPLLFLVAADLAGFGMVLADIQLRAEHDHAAGWLIGLILSSMFVVQVVASPLWGRVADRTGQKRIVILCTILSAVSMVIYGLAHSVPMLIASRILAGLAAANVSVIQAWLGGELEGERKTAVMGQIGAALTAGLVVGPAIGGFLAKFGGNELVGFTAAGVSGLGVVAVALFSSEKPRDIEHSHGQGHRSKILGVPGLAALMVLASIAWFSLACLEGTFARLLEHRWHQDQIAFGLVMAFESAVGFVVQGWLVGRISGRFGDSGLVKWGLLLQGIGLASMPFFPVFGLVFIGSGIYSLGSSLMGPGLNSWCSELTPPEQQATLFGTLQGARSFGFIVGPILGGALFDYNNGLPYLCAGLVCTAGSYISTKIPQSSPHRTTAHV